MSIETLGKFLIIFYFNLHIMCQNINLYSKIIIIPSDTDYKLTLPYIIMHMPVSVSQEHSI